MTQFSMPPHPGEILQEEFLEPHDGSPTWGWSINITDPTSHHEAIGRDLRMNAAIFARVSTKEQEDGKRMNVV